MTTTAIYTRVSLDATGDMLAVSRQLADCERMARERGWTVSKRYEDNSISASKEEVTRPAYNQMIADYDAGKFDALICWDLDRLTRQPVQLEAWIKRAAKKGLKLTTANGEADLTTDGGQMYARIKAAVALAEVQRKGARQRAANKQRMIEQGDVYGRHPLWGWKDVKCREIDEEAAGLIRQAVADILAGKSTRDIAEQWNAAGVLAPGGKPWLTATVRTTLLRPTNAGIVTYKDEEHREIKPLWAPLFDVETYDALKFELSTRTFRKASSQKIARKYLMGGLARCGKCGSTMQGGVQKSGVNYLCSGRANGCYRAIRVEVLDAFVLKYTAIKLSLHDPEDYLPTDNVIRLKEIGQELHKLQVRRETIAADLDLDYSIQTSLMNAVRDREKAIQAEAAELTKDSAIAALMRELTMPFDTGDIDTDCAQMASHIDTIAARLKKLSLRQQRMLVQEFGSYEILDRSSKPRVRIV